MTGPLPPQDPQDDLDSSLRRLAQNTHPRPAFVNSLRVRLKAGQAGEAGQRKPLARRLAAAVQSALRSLFSFRSLGSWIGQGALVLALLGLVLLAGRLLDPRTPRSTQVAGEPAGTAVPGQPAVPYFESGRPPETLARLGKGQILSLDTARDGRIVVGSSAGVCLYGGGMAEVWCRWTASQVDSARFSLGGDLLAVHIQDSERVEIWDAATGQVRATRSFSFDPALLRAMLNGEVPSTPTVVIAWEPAPSLAGSRSSTAQDPAPGPTITPIPAGYPVGEPTDTPRLAIATLNKELFLWDWANDSLAWGPLTIETLPAGLDWSGSTRGDSLLAVLTQRGVVLYDGQTGEGKWQEDSNVGPDASSPRALDISPDGRFIAHDRSLTTLEGYNPGSVETIDQLPEHFAYAQDAKRLAIQYGSEVAILNPGMPDDRQVYPAAAHSPLAWSQINSGLFFVQPDGALALTSGDMVEFFPLGNTNAIQGLSWSEGVGLLSGSGLTLHTWDPQSGQLAAIRQVTMPGLELAGFSADGSRAAYLDYPNRAITLWNVPENQPIAGVEMSFLNTGSSAGGLLGVTFAADGQRAAAAAADGRLYFYTIDVDSAGQGDVAAPYDAGGGVQVHSMALQPGGDRLAIGYSGAEGDRLVLVTGAGEVQKIVELPDSVSSLAWSPDGGRLAAALGSAVWIYDAGSFKVLHTITTGYELLAESLAGSYPINLLAWSPDGSRLAAAGNSITVYDLNNAQISHTIYPPVTPFYGLAFRPDGLALASAGRDALIFVWDLGAGPLPPNEAQPTATPLPYPPPNTDRSYPAPADTADPLTGPQVSPTPLPAEPTQAPTEVDLAEYDLSLSTYVSPYNGWTLEFLRGEWTERATKFGGEVRDLNRFTFYDASLNPIGSIEEYPPHGLSESVPSAFTWSFDGRYLYITDEVRQDACGGMLYHNLRRISLEAFNAEHVTMIIDRVPLFDDQQTAVFSLAPDGSQLAVVAGAQVEIVSLTGDGSQSIIPFDPPANQEFGAPLAPTWSPAGERLAFQIRAPYPSCAGEYESVLVVIDIRSGSARRMDLPASFNRLTGWQDDQTLRLVDIQGLEYLFDVDLGGITPEPPQVEARQVLVDAIYNASDGVYRAIRWLSVPEVISSQPGLERYRVWAEFNAQQGGIYSENGQTRFAFTIQRLADGQLHLLDPLPGAPGDRPDYAAHLPIEALREMSPTDILGALVDEWLATHVSGYATKRLLEYELNQVNVTSSPATIEEALQGMSGEITFSVRPAVLLYSDWAAGNGALEDGWMRQKFMLVRAVADGEVIHLQLVGTGP